MSVLLTLIDEHQIVGEGDIRIFTRLVEEKDFDGLRRTLLRFYALKSSKCYIRERLSLLTEDVTRTPSPRVAASSTPGAPVRASIPDPMNLFSLDDTSPTLRLAPKQLVFTDTMGTSTSTNHYGSDDGKKSTEKAFVAGRGRVFLTQAYSSLILMGNRWMRTMLAFFHMLYHLIRSVTNSVMEYVSMKVTYGIVLVWGTSIILTSGVQCAVRSRQMKMMRDCVKLFLWALLVVCFAVTVSFLLDKVYTSFLHNMRFPTMNWMRGTQHILALSNASFSLPSLRVDECGEASDAQSLRIDQLSNDVKNLWRKLDESTREIATLRAVAKYNAIRQPLTCSSVLECVSINRFPETSARVNRSPFKSAANPANTTAAVSSTELSVVQPIRKKIPTAHATGGQCSLDDIRFLNESHHASDMFVQAFAETVITRLATIEQTLVLYPSVVVVETPCTCTDETARVDQHVQQLQALTDRLNSMELRLQQHDLDKQWENTVNQVVVFTAGSATVFLLAALAQPAVSVSILSLISSPLSVIMSGFRFVGTRLGMTALIAAAAVPPAA